MSKVKVTMNRAGCDAVRLSGGVAADLMRRAEAVASRACGSCSPDGMDSDPYVAKQSDGRHRAGAVVLTATPHGANDNRKKATLLHALDAGRG